MKILAYLLWIPEMAHAQEPSNLGELIGRINKFLLNPIIMFLFALAFVMFVYGLFNFFKNKDSAEGIEQGKRHMTWGLIGMFIMVSVFSIMNLVIRTIGVEDNIRPGETTEVTIPDFDE